MLFILSSMSSCFEFWLIIHISIYENSELDVFKNIKFLGERSNNWPSDLLGANAYKILESCC